MIYVCLGQTVAIALLLISLALSERSRRRWENIAERWDSLYRKNDALVKGLSTSCDILLKSVES